MSLKPIDPRHFASDDVEGDQSEVFSHGAHSMNHYGAQHRATSDSTWQAGSIGTAHARSGRSVGQDSKKKTLVAVIGVVIVLLVVAIGLAVGVTSCSNEVTQQEAGEGKATVTIPSGYGAGDIAQLLRDNGVISSTTEFIQAVSRQGASGSLKPGTYTFERGTSYDELVNILIVGPAVTGITITIPEGLTVSQVAQRVAETFPISYDEFMAQAKASNYIGEFPFLNGAYNDSLEGFLFPKTYTFAEGVTSDTIIRTMLQQFQKETVGLDWSLATQGGVVLTQYEVVVMASLVERETAVAEERPQVASVMFNRLNVGMQLQIDASVAYALNKNDLLTYDDLQVDSPYNLYLNYGLCPGPICSPSLSSIEAVLAAAQTDYYYYVASPALDGTHTFCSTYEEFEVAKAAYNQAMGI